MSSKFERYTLFPIKYPILYKLYEKQRDAFWVPKEVDLETDVKEWREKLTENDKHFITYTLSFFAQADGIVLQNIDNNFSIDISIPEATLFYGIQAGIEAIHWETYSFMIETLIDDKKERDKAFHAIENYPCIKEKAEWILKWMNGKQSYLLRLIAFACTEGIFFSSAFASIYYYKKRGLMPGLCFSNKLIARDEGLHRDFGCELFKILKDLLNNNVDEFVKILGEKEYNLSKDVVDKHIYEIVEEAVNIEISFVKNSLNVDLIGINIDSMIQYVYFVADHLLITLGLNKKYKVSNPFDWMDMISLTSKQNFFEGRVSEYKKVNVDTTFAIDDDF